MSSSPQSSDSAWREDLYLRIDALGPAVRQIVGAKTGLGDHDIEDLWATMAEKAVRPPGTSGALKEGAESWPEHSLREWLIGVLSHRATDHWRGTANRRTGEQHEVPTGDIEFAGHSEDTSDVVASRHGVDIWTRAITEEAGDDVAQLLVMQAAGATVSEQRDMLGISDNQRRTLLDRATRFQRQIAAKAYGALVFIPEAVVRWWIALTGGGRATAQIGSGLAGLVVLGGGGLAIEHERSKPAKPVPTLAPVLDASRGTAAAVTAAVEQAPVVAEREARAEQRKAAAREAAAARKARKKAAAAGPSLAGQEFSGSQNEGSSAPAKPAAPQPAAPSSNSGSLAAEEFLPSGR